ncbi:hypothetical protein CSC70_05295 [Pseudoxanthomonas kalamensis DSM 18571]|uniref:hypothetical protein n=1 Tax=Pseudoxanthomonas kalamensis TaxID=289483 RepID=UPI0013910A1F|nr:hypothetical protein [Pseudoxanthomonas kalamensis]KAF1711326.1 hypothetical protein CSC70_05295 [Pseudoxanthomonas kalamensis DSM 18571]
MRALCGLLTLLLAFASMGWPKDAAAQQVQRCTSLSGETVYTDKRCEDVGAIDRLPDVRRPSSSSYYRRGCSRTLSDLVYQITAAIDARDVNRLAGVYQWGGVSDATANRILDRLEAIAQRPLVDIVPIRPDPPPILDEEGNIVDDNADGYYPQTTRTRPTGLRLEQTLKNSATPSTTVFGLRRAYNCFWITL